MRPVRSLFLYFLAVFVGGALLAPWLYWAAKGLAPHSAAIARLAANPFHRFLGRALLGVAILGLYPLWRSCKMAHWRTLGLRAKMSSPKGLALGFLLGFASLACAALLALGLGGRSLVHGHNAGQIERHIVNATVAAVIVAVLEEIIFRGTLFGILRKVLTWPGALLTSSVVYALVHFLENTDLPGPVRWFSGLALLGRMFQSGPPLVPAVFTLLVAGAILAMAYQKTGTLYLSIGLHAGWIFWLKSYGFFTASAPSGNPVFWGSSRLIDGWLALPLLGGVFWMISRMKSTAGAAHGD